MSRWGLGRAHPAPHFPSQIGRGAARPQILKQHRATRSRGLRFRGFSQWGWIPGPKVRREPQPERGAFHLSGFPQSPTPPAQGRPRRAEPGRTRGKGASHTCAKTVRLPSRGATFTRPWSQAAPVPARATPATAAAKGPGFGTARRLAANPRRSVPPQAARRALLPAAAIFAEAPQHLSRSENLSEAQISRDLSTPPPFPRPRLLGLRAGCGCPGDARSGGRSPAP
jgi:hypothetical protein